MVSQFTFLTCSIKREYAKFSACPCVVGKGSLIDGCKVTFSAKLFYQYIITTQVPKRLALIARQFYLISLKTVKPC